MFKKMLFGVLLFFTIAGMTNPVYAKNIQEQNVTIEEFNDIVNAINDTNWKEEGQSIIVGDKYLVEFSDVSDESTSESSVYSVYTNTQSASHKYTVKVLFTNQTAFIFTQTVTYHINDYAGTVDITDYSVKVESKLNSYTCTVYEDSVINNELNTYQATARKSFLVTKNSNGSYVIIACSVLVNRTGTATFYFDIV